MLRLVLLMLVGLLDGCMPTPEPTTQPANLEGGAATFTFAYEVALGRDCFMMGNCGERLVLSPDGRLRRFDDQGEETGGVEIPAEERRAFLEALNAAGFFELPALLPEVPEEEMQRGGRTVVMTFEQAGGGRDHRVEAHPDVVTAPMPEAFFVVEALVHTALLGRIEGD
jgi:hypothetical protein